MFKHAEAHPTDPTEYEWTTSDPEPRPLELGSDPDVRRCDSSWYPSVRELEADTLGPLLAAV